MVPAMSVSHGLSSSLENVRSKHRAQEERSVRVHIVLQPHVIQESSVSQLRYEPRLQQCRIRCRIHRSIEKVRSNQIILCLTRPYYDHQALLDRVTACVSHTENTTKFCGSGESRMHYLGHCDKTTILYCTACCAVQCKLN